MELSRKSQFVYFRETAHNEMLTNSVTEKSQIKENEPLDLTSETKSKGNGHKYEQIFFGEANVNKEDEEEEEEEEDEENDCVGLLGVAKDRLHRFSCLGFLLSLIPIISWLPRYKWRKDLPYDIVSGFTVAVMHIPQGMAYGMLAGVEPVVGIYTAFSPVLIYTILGTMPHVSMGTFAVVSILVSKPVLRLGGDPEDIDSEEVVVGGEENFTRLQVATAVTLGVGIIQTCLGLFRLGSFSILLTDCLVSAFSVGASFHVFTSQLKHLLGISIPTISGPGRLIYTYNALGLHLVDVNLVSLAISVVSILLLVLSDQAVAPRLKGICNFPLPSQLIVVSFATLLSHSLQLSEVHNEDNRRYWRHSNRLAISNLASPLSARPGASRMSSYRRSCFLNWTGFGQPVWF